MGRRLHLRIAGESGKMQQEDLVNFIKEQHELPATATWTSLVIVSLSRISMPLPNNTRWLFVMT